VKGTLDSATAVLTFPVGILVGIPGLLLLAAASLSDTPEAPRAAFAGLLAVLNVAAVYFVWRKFWAPPRRPDGVTRAQRTPPA
jgi:hypothetical protein